MYIADFWDEDMYVIQKMFQRWTAHSINIESAIARFTWRIIQIGLINQNGFKAQKKKINVRLSNSEKAMKSKITNFSSVLFIDPRLCKFDPGCCKFSIGFQKVFHNFESLCGVPEIT